MSNQDALGEDAGQQFVNQKAYEGDEASKKQNCFAIKSVYDIKFQTDSMIFRTTSHETHPKVTLSLVWRYGLPRSSQHCCCFPSFLLQFFLPGLLGLFTGDPRAPKFPVQLWVRRHRRPLWNATPIISEEPWAAVSERGLNPMTCTMLGRYGYGTVAAPFEFQSFLKYMLLKYSPITEALLAFLEDKYEWNKRNWVIWRVWFFFACLYQSS